MTGYRAWIAAGALALAACTNSLAHEPTPQAKLPAEASVPESRAEQPNEPSAPELRAAPDQPSAPAQPSAAEQPRSAAAVPPAERAPEQRAALPPTAASESYPGTGFILHEWGTNTVVVGSDGSLQRGLHHPGDDLPAFVYDRIHQGAFLGYPAVDKMETPVDYFYSDRPLSVRVRVDMPRGVLTQWYPAVDTFLPAVLMSNEALIDPIVSDYPYRSQQCIDKYSKLGPGTLDWGSVEVLARDAASAVLPEAPLDRYTWSYAREVAANLVRVNNPTAVNETGTPVRSPQSERFLFYRGLGNFDPPLLATASIDANGTERAKLTKPQAWSSPAPAFLLNVGETQAAFRRIDSLPESGTFESELPAAAVAIDQFVDMLARDMTLALIGTGLYRDEATAMVNTWRRQWFRTPGVRVLYFAPASWLDREVPLTVTPAPDTTLRVMVMRVELLTPSVEARDLKAALALDDPSAADSSRAYFRALGRFAEPRLRRALWLIGKQPAQGAWALLTEIEGPNVSWALGE